MLDKEKIFPLELEVFRLIRDFIKDYCGIYFDDDSRYLLEKRLSRRIALHHFSSFREYYRYLLYHGRRDEELSAIIDIITVNETYFFREQNQLRAFSEEILHEIPDMKKDRKRLRIWSAGCSTGEEPYSLAMLIMEKNLFTGWNVEIFGSDINQRVLQVARNGLYRKNSFRTTEPYFLHKYFREEDNAWRITDAVKQYVTFSHLNLLDPNKVKLMGDIDILFCRNVMIYFDHPSRKKVVEMFHERLNGGGYLLLGHAESLISLSTAFTLKHLRNDMVYQKPA
jgi:chemotaxis protein methyltransferase CheR